MNRKVTFDIIASHPGQGSPESPRRGSSFLLEEGIDSPSFTSSPEMLLAI